MLRRILLIILWTLLVLDGGQVIAGPQTVLMVMTSADQLKVTAPDGRTVVHPTGYWGEEFRVPYEIFRQAGFTVEIASPKGPNPPLDAVSDDDAMKAFLTAHPGLMKSVKKLRQVGHGDALFIVGGHGAMVDLSSDPDLDNLIYQHMIGTGGTGGIISAVCHGPVGFLRQAWMVSGLQVTGFSDEEEAVAEANFLGGKVPYSLEQGLKKLGARYERGPAWQSFVVVDRKIVHRLSPVTSLLTVITGQNPASSGDVARAVVKELNNR